MTGATSMMPNWFDDIITLMLLSFEKKRTRNPMFYLYTLKKMRLFTVLTSLPLVLNAW